MVKITTFVKSETDVCPQIFRSKSLKTPKEQHIAMKITLDEITELKENVEREIEKRLHHTTLRAEREATLAAL